MSQYRMLVLRLFFMASTALLLSCATAPHGAAPQQQWPDSPNPTRIVWMGAAHTPEEVGIGTGFWGSMWRKITGGENDPIARPYGIHADCRNRILVVDSMKRGVHLYDREEHFYYFVEGLFTLPIGVTEDENNIAYVTDSAAGKIFKFNLGERRPVVFAEGLQRPTGITFNAVNQLIYVTDTLASQIVAFDRQGREVLRFGAAGSGPGQFNLPTDLATDLQGRIYVTDPLNARIQIFTRSGAFIKSFGEAGDALGFFGKAKGVAVNSEGHIYVCDAQYDRIQVFDFAGRLLVSFGSTGHGKGEFWMPSGIAIDKNDNIYIADTYNNRFQMLGYIWLD